MEGRACGATYLHCNGPATPPALYRRTQSQNARHDGCRYWESDRTRISDRRPGRIEFVGVVLNELPWCVFPSLHHRKEGNTLDFNSFTPVQITSTLTSKHILQRDLDLAHVSARGIDPAKGLGSEA